MSLAFLGVNKRANRNDISEGESPDAANCFFADDKLGTLGQRKGKTVVNPQGFSTIVTGRTRFLLANGSERSVVALNNGEILNTDLSPAGITTYLTGNTATGKSLATSTLDLDYPSTTAALNSTFQDSSTFDPDDSTFCSWGMGIGFTGNSGWSGAKRLRYEAGINESGVAKYLWLYEITIDWSTLSSMGGAVPAAPHNAWNTITGACFRLTWPDGWPTGAGAGDKVSLSALLAG